MSASRAAQRARDRSGDKLFLNILPTSIHDPEFANEDFQRVLDELGLAPENLVLEVSERQAISNYPIFREAIDHFLRLGFGIALDDTGAGYSSLEAALELNPDFLKVDMSLIRGIDDNPQKQELLSGLQRLASRMNATVIAEGIETEAELETVAALGCTYGQGYAIGRGTPLCRSSGGSQSSSGSSSGSRRLAYSPRGFFERRREKICLSWCLRSWRRTRSNASVIASCSSRACACAARSRSFPVTCRWSSFSSPACEIATSHFEVSGNSSRSAVARSSHSSRTLSECGTSWKWIRKLTDTSPSCCPCCPCCPCRGRLLSRSVAVGGSARESNPPKT